MSRTAADILTTLLWLNLASAYIRGGAEITIGGETIETPGFGISLLFLLLWLGVRLVPAHRHRIRGFAADAIPWLRGRIPEALVAALFIIGLTMRLWGGDFGAPLILHPDENVVVGASMYMLKEGSLAPPVPYRYPTVFYYLLLPAFALVYVRGKSHGLWKSLEEIDVHTFQFYEIARAHSAVLGALTILVTFAIARRMWPGVRGRWTGVLAATYVTFAFNHVKESHYAVTDATLTFLVSLAFLAIVAAFQSGTRWRFGVAGFAVGIACATKYSALPLVAPLIGAHVMDRGRWSDWRRLGLALAAVPLGFFAGYPYALLNWPPFLEHLGWMSSHAGSRSFDPDARLATITKYAMESGLGPVFTLLFAAAGIYATFRRRRLESLVVLFTVMALSLMSKTAFSFYVRYLLPILPLAAVLVSSFILEIAEALRAWSGRAGRMLAPAAIAALALIIVVPQAQESFAFIRYVTSPDTRVQAYERILAQVPSGATLAVEEPYLTLPGDYRVLRWTPLHNRSVEEFADRNVDVLVMSSDRDVHEPGEFAERRRELRRRFPLLAAFTAGPGGSVGPTIEIRVKPPQ